MMARILLAEDDREIANLERDYLEMSGHEVVIAPDGEEAMKRINEEKFDLLILDIMMPKKSGYDICREIREQIDIPILMVTAKTESVDKIRGLGLGADDYIVKPFEMLELLVRMEKVLERTVKKEESIQIHGVTIYPERHLVLKDGEEVVLKPMEFECLMMFVKYKNIALSREQILKGLWGVEFEGETRTVDVHVAQLRKKLDFGDVIKTIPKVGYRLEGE